MPIYTYKCERCGHEEEQVVSYAEREKSHPCPLCGEESLYQGIERPYLGQPAYQMKAFTERPNGAREHIPGHFAKDAKRNRGK
jgi:putative FmdB family regulatory protein